jgi:hypothetical protein
MTSGLVSYQPRPLNSTDVPIQSVERMGFRHIHRHKQYHLKQWGVT